MNVKVKVFVAIICMIIACAAHAQTYQYDQSGRLTADASEQIASIEWNNQSKIVKLTRTAGSTKPDLEFAYDASGNRYLKIVKPRNANGLEPQFKWIYTYYEHEIKGPALAIYEKQYESLGNNQYTSSLVKISNALLNVNRMGMFDKRQELMELKFRATLDNDGQFNNVEELGVMVPAYSTSVSTEKGRKQFEQINHLGDVALIYTDRKTASGASTQQATMYYAFGMTMPGMDFKAGESYRYGFGGAEKDDDIRGEDGSYEFPGRSIYDPRLGRFTSIDPLWRIEPGISPYAYAANSPIAFSDESGEQKHPYQMQVAMKQAQQAISIYLEKGIGADEFKGYHYIDENSTNADKFYTGIADELIDVLSVIDPMTWKASATDLYALAEAAVAGDVGAEEAMQLIQNSYNEIKERVVSSTNPNDKEFVYTWGKNTVAIAAAALAAVKARKLIPGAKAVKELTGCFVGDTEILTYGGKFVYIKDISTEKEFYHLSEEDLKKLEEERAAQEYVIEITLENLKFVVEEDQLFFVNDDWKKATDLQEGDELLKLDGSTVKVKSVQKIKKSDLAAQAKAVVEPVADDMK